MNSFLAEQIHQRYEAGAYDNWLVWAGNSVLYLDGIACPGPLARCALGQQKPTCQLHVEMEIFVSGLTAEALDTDDLCGRLHLSRTDDEYQLPMVLAVDESGQPQRRGDNWLLVSQPLEIDRTGVYTYRLEVSADGAPRAAADKIWIDTDAIAPMPRPTIVVSPDWVAAAPSIMEVCLRKVGARMEGDRFVSGTIPHLTRQLDTTAAQVVHLLPFCQPGFTDAASGQDVRKGTLGSVYAIADFYAIDTALIAPFSPEDGPTWAAQGLLTTDELASWPQGGPQQQQLAGRAQLRALVRRAHQLDKRVIFDLVLMQTSRDTPLIDQHPNWYVLDETGRPSIHQIAWLVYSDVALLDLANASDLQDYLLDMAAYWLTSIGFDGVRIDASQTVDRAFLRHLKNRLNDVNPQALVLGETLCPLEEAVDIPLDMIYSLMVDWHLQQRSSAEVADFMEEYHRRFAAGTVALAYFENHDSQRATPQWQQRFDQVLQDDPQAAKAWNQRHPQPGLLMALLKNLQASLFNATAGWSQGVELAYGLEWGSQWGEAQPTDFEQTTLLQPQLQHEPLRAALVQGYNQLHQMQPRQGRVFYYRANAALEPIDPDLLAYSRYSADQALLILHNFSPTRPLQERFALDYLAKPVQRYQIEFDTYQLFDLAAPGADLAWEGDSLAITLQPLQSLVLRLL
ncbi:MAG: hypothetical protein GKR89_06125 [Candidatus Latescibacteria bacterium]|nr:hypothetical protein [Candidatus Latescibacterota bacterium]